jgi:tetratricopeptide (TPR) repeat protein
LPIGLELAEKAVEMAPDEPGGYEMLGMLALSKRDYEQAIAYREKALTLAPNDFVVLSGLGHALYIAGEPEQAIDIYKRAMRINPSNKGWLSWSLAEAQLVAGHYEDAIETSNRSATRQPDHVIRHIHLTAAYDAVGRLEEAQAEAAKVLQIDPKFTVSAWVKSRLLKDAADTERYAYLLLNAGLPEN